MHSMLLNVKAEPVELINEDPGYYGWNDKKIVWFNE